MHQDGRFGWLDVTGCVDVMVLNVVVDVLRSCGNVGGCIELGRH